jgi:hypothetical protein
VIEKVVLILAVPPPVLGLWPLQVRAVQEAAARREAALQEELAAVKAEAAAAAGDEGRLGSQLAAKEAELANLQLALGELSYEVGRYRGQS